MKDLKKWLRNNFYLFFLIILILIFFYPFILQGKIPIPADTILGMYHPWRDLVWDNFKNGVPFKNFLITDPVRQQYVWRKLVFDQLKTGQLPLWNPYSFSGTLLLANFQSAVFYPLNLLFFIFPFNISWGVLVMLQPLLAGLFLYLYLKEIKVSSQSSLLSGLVFAFCGFSVAWLEWNTILHTIVWTPLMLLSIDKVFGAPIERSRIKNYKLRTVVFWSAVLIFSLSASFFAGHLQIFFYCFIVVFFYITAKIYHARRNRLKLFLIFIICYLLSVILTSPQWIPAFRFISLSARNIDQSMVFKDSWFIPWQNLIQFVAPDFFGNPATGNYWGVWNYAEFVGYIGIIPLVFAFYALFFRFDRKTLFWGSVVFLGLIFSLPTPLAKIPYILKIPFMSTSQPTRLLSFICLGLAILSGLGYEIWHKEKNHKKLLIAYIVPFIILSVGWLTVLFFRYLEIKPENALIAKRNLLLPTIFFISSLFILIVNKFIKFLGYWFVVLLIVFDLFRFGWKFTPFTKEGWIFPETKIISYLKKNIENYRIMVLDRRIMPPNFSVYYDFQDVSGYDPLYLSSYGQFVSSWNEDKAVDFAGSFNRIITPQNYQSFVADLLGVKYILSFGPLDSYKLEYITCEGETYLYKNKNAYPRVFFVDKVVKTNDIFQELEKMFELRDKLKFTAVSSEDIKLVYKGDRSDEAKIIDYREGLIKIKTKTKNDRLLVLTDIYYPNWQVYIDDVKAKLLRVDFLLRAVLVPKGDHKIEFKINLI